MDKILEGFEIAKDTNGEVITKCVKVKKVGLRAKRGGSDELWGLLELCK